MKQIKFNFHDGNFVRRDILPGDKASDLKEILGVPEDTKCNFLYAGYFIDPDPSSSELDTNLYHLIQPPPDGPDFILVSMGEIPHEYIQAKWRNFSRPPDGVKPLGYHTYPSSGFTKDDYNRYRSLVMEQISDYSILTHGRANNHFFFVPENITLNFVSEFGSSVESQMGDHRHL